MTETVVPAAPRTAGERVDITFAGQPWSLAGLGFYNTLLTLLTLGVYSFWGRTEVRRRLWSMVRLNGEPLEYTGTGKELFLGFLFAMGVVFLPAMLFLLAIAFAFGPHRCLGMHLARMESRVVLEAVFDRLPNVRFDPEAKDPHITGELFRSPLELPVLFDRV